MQTKYKYIHFVERHNEGKTRRFNCCNIKLDELIGIVKWYGAFRGYSFFPEWGSIYSQGCLDDISHFMQQLKEVKA